ncbi:MAG: DNRLRE domain-containing protein [Nitrospirota bacterium]
MSQYYNLIKFSKHNFSRFLFYCFASFAILNLVLFLSAGKVYSGQATLSWDPPTTNADGTPLLDLAGYNVYYGNTSSNYSQIIDVGNITTYTVASLNDGTYYFAVTAYDTSGNESEYSNEVSKTIQSTQQYTLTLNKSGTGSGTVTSSPTGINCGTDCSEAYNAGTVVTLTASPATGSTFTGWSGGGCTGTGMCSISINANTTVTATFSTSTSYIITATAGSGGSISPSGSVSVNYGASQTFTITANTNYSIANVLVDGTSVGAVSTYTFSNVTANHTITVTFSSSSILTEEWGDTPTSNHPNAVEDTFINLDSNNYSTDTTLNTYTWPTDSVANAILIKWDLSSIPAGSTIINATLSLYLQGYEGTGGDDLYDISVHKIINYDPVITLTTGYTYDGVNNWSPSTGTYNDIPLAQGDISPAEDVKSIDKTLDYKSWNVTQIVQDWVNNSSTNYGMLLNSDPSAISDSNRFFASSEYPNSDQRPKLVITYTPSLSHTITASAGSGGSISPSGSVSVDYGASQTFAITANTNYSIANVLVDGTSVGAVSTYTFSNVTENHTISASFTMNTYNLSVTKAGTGSSTAKAGIGYGTITSSPSGISCGSACSYVYNTGTVVTLTATPDASSTFAGWSGGGCTGTGTCSITVNSNTTVTATFTLKTYTITATAGSGGSISPSGSVSVNYGASQTFTITANTNYSIANVLVDDTSVGAVSTYTFSNVTANHTISASFTINTYNLSVTKTGTGTGTVTSSPAGINCGTDCSEAYNAGTVVTLTASPATGSTFTGWSGGGCTGTGTCSITVNANTTVTATFTKQTGISVTSPNGSDTWQAGTTQTIRWTYTGSLGSYVKIELLKGGAVVSTLTSYARTSSGAYNWKIPTSRSSGSDYQIRVSDRKNSSVNGTSGNFTIEGPPPPEITVTRPVGGETWVAKSKERISWTYKGDPGSYVIIELLKGDNVVKTITSYARTTTGYYNWTIPYNQTLGTDYRIRIKSRSYSNVYSTSNYFTIKSQ